MRNILIYDNEVVMGLTSNEAWSLIMPDNLTCRVKMWISSSETWWIKYFPGQWGVSDACLPVRNSYAGVKWYEEMNVNIFPSDHILLFSKPTQTAWHYIILCLQICFHIKFFARKKNHALTCHIKSLLNQGRAVYVLFQSSITGSPSILHYSPKLGFNERP